MTLAALEKDLRAMMTADAWREYRDRIHGLDPHVYDQVEPWAWDLLQRRLASQGGSAATVPSNSAAA